MGSAYLEFALQLGHILVDPASLVKNGGAVLN